jgi:large subunit ribosomal protein L20
VKAGVHAYVDRRKKKRTSRTLWQIRINAFAREQGTSYSKLIDLFKKNQIELDRKVLSQIAAQYPEILIKVLEGLNK